MYLRKNHSGNHCSRLRRDSSKIRVLGRGDCGSRLILLRVGALLVAGGRVARWGISYFYEGRATRRDSACRWTYLSSRTVQSRWLTRWLKAWTVGATRAGNAYGRSTRMTRKWGRGSSARGEWLDARVCEAEMLGYPGHLVSLKYIFQRVLVLIYTTASTTDAI